MQSCSDFRNVLARIFFLQNVADILRIDESTSVTDIETSTLLNNADRRNDLDEQLIKT